MDDLEECTALLALRSVIVRLADGLRNLTVSRMLRIYEKSYVLRANEVGWTEQSLR